MTFGLVFGLAAMLALAAAGLGGCQSAAPAGDDVADSGSAFDPKSAEDRATAMADLRLRGSGPVVQRPAVSWADGAGDAGGTSLSMGSGDLSDRAGRLVGTAGAADAVRSPGAADPSAMRSASLGNGSTDPLTAAAAAIDTTANQTGNTNEWSGAETDVVTLGPGVAAGSTSETNALDVLADARAGANVDSVPQTRAEILRQTIEELGHTPDEPLRLALDQAAIHAAMGGTPWSESELVAAFPNLNPRSRQRVGEYRALLGRLHDEMVRSGDSFNPDPLWRDLESTSGDEMASVRITDLQLCASVAGFGQYQPLASERMLAGINHPAVLYTELDGFQPRQLADGRYETSLSQEIRLYDDSDDLVVWQRGPETLQDVSNKQRRDFYICQNLTIPANLGVGRYRMKVTVIDQHADTMWEQTLSLEIVADMALTDADPSGWGR